MAKLEKASDDVQELINKIMEETGLVNWINVIPFAVSKQSQLVKIAKASPTVEYISKQDGSVVIYVYEEAFEKLTDIQKELVMWDAINLIHYDGEKDKISIVQPQIGVTLDGRAKYGDDLLNAVEAGVLAMKQIEDERKDKR